eukprot:gene5604-4026_t
MSEAPQERCSKSLVSQATPNRRAQTIAPQTPRGDVPVPDWETPGRSKSVESDRRSVPHLTGTVASMYSSVKFTDVPSACNEKLRVDRSYIPLEHLEHIKRIFEAYDFVKTGKSAQMDVEVRRMRLPQEPKKRDLMHRRHSMQITDETEADRLLPPLRVDDDETSTRRRRLLLFGLITTRPGIDSEHREDGQDECLLPLSSEDDSDEAEEDEEDTFMDCAAAQRLYERETAVALHHIEANQKIVDDEIRKMESWKMHQRMLRAEAKANREVNALANMAAPTVPLPLSVIPSSAGVPFVFFAQQIAARYFSFFFPINPGVRTFQPRRKQHIKAVKELFRLMDTNADDLVSWDEFSAHILQAGQRFILETELRRAAAAAAAGRSSSRNSSQQDDAAVAGPPAADEADSDEAVAPSANVEYELTFTPEPTNSSSWQATYPLVHHLYHEEPITKIVVSDRSRRYITGGPDGLVKLWRPDPRLLDSQHRMAIVHERNLVCTRAAITDMALSTVAMGDAEVVAASAMDGTITLMRTSTGEVVRTLLGVRGAEESGVAVLNDLAARGADREKKEFEADDLLSLRNRQPVVAGTVVRMPYTIPAYHNDMMEIFFGKTNRYFQGLDVVAPTYTHLKRPVASSSDVLYDFGAEKLLKRLAQRGEAPETTRKCWFATALAVARCNPLASNACLKDGAYLVLGFEAGVVQAYELNMNWFCVTQLSATRVEPPSPRKPVHSFLVHDGSVSGIIISDTADLMITSSDDGTLQVRQFSRLNVPHITLGEGIPNNSLVPPMLRQLRSKRGAKSSSPGSSRRQSMDSSVSAHSSKGGAEPSGHTKRITCMCWNEENHLIVSGSMDHCVAFWTSRSHRLIRQLDLRDMQNTVQGLADLGSCGYPIDVSFMERNSDPLRLIVLDSKRVIRLLNALNGSFMGVLVDHSPSSVALGDMLVARYERFDDRLLLGGRCVRAWDIPRDEEYARDYFGHRKPVIFMSIDPTLKLIVTADEDNIVMWNFSIVPHERALQRREDRRLNREKARAKARKDAEKRRALRLARKQRDALLAAEEEERKAKESGTVPRMTPNIFNDVDEEEEDEEGGLGHRRESIHSKDDDSEEEEIASINATAYEDEIPFIHHLDGNQFNLTYYRTGSRVVRTWKVEGGVRCVTLETSTRAGGIYVALLRERAIIQYNSFNGAALRKFVFPETACDIYSLFAGEAILNQTENALAPLLTAAYEEDSHSGIASIYHLNHGGGDPDSAFKRELQEEAELEARGAQGGACTSVAILPSLGVVVLGGKGSLGYSPITESTSHAIACTNLQEEPPKERKREREAAIRAANLSMFSGFSDMNNINLVIEDWKAPLNLMALFPGRLIPDPTADAQRQQKGKLPHHSSGGEPSTAKSTDAPTEEASVIAVPTKLVGEDEDGDTNEAEKADEKKEPGNYFEEGQKDSLGFIGHIVPVRDLGYIFTGTNDGILQLWNIRSSSEVLRCRATLRVEAITSPAAHSDTTSLVAPPGSAGGMPPAERSTSSCWSKNRRNLLKDAYYVAVGDQSGYVLLLDFNELPWEEDVPLDVIPGIETKVVVLDRWRAHRHDVRGVCFVGNPDVRGSDIVGHEYHAGLRRSFVPDGVVNGQASTNTSTRAGRSPCTAHPMTIVTTGEDTYTYVWTWESGTINCLGCFGGGELSPITPPLTQLPKKSLNYFEAARRQYVLQRLVVGYKFFNGHNVQNEVENAVLEMEREANRLAEEDVTWQLAFWGSMAALSGDRLPYRETLWTPPRKSAIRGERSPVFDRAGYRGTQDRMYRTPENTTQRPPTNNPVTARGRGGRMDSMMVDSTTDVYAPYVFAFMRGTYDDDSVRDCLLRIVKELRPRIKKLVKKNKGRTFILQRVGSLGSSRHRLSDQSSTSALPEAETAGSAEEMLLQGSLEPKRNSTASILEEPTTVEAPPLGPPPAPPGTARVAEVKQEDLEESVAGSSDVEHDVTMRGILGIPIYKVAYKQPGITREVHCVAFKEGAAAEDEFVTREIPPGTVDPVKLAGMLPRIVTEEVRLAAAQGNPINALSTRRVSFSEGQGRRGTGAGGAAENLEEAALQGECATTIVERAYIGRRREEAIRQILKEQIEADIPASAAKEKAQEIQLSIDAGLIAIDTYQDFAHTHTSNVLFDKERVLVEPVVETHTKIPESFIKNVVPTSFNIKQMGEMRDVPSSPDGDDWYAEREKVKRQRRFQDSLWAPSRIVQTLLNWESPIPPHMRQQKEGVQSVLNSAGVSRKPSARPPMVFPVPPLMRPPSEMDEEERERQLQLPNFLPDYLYTGVAKGKASDYSSNSRFTPTGGISASGARSSGNEPPAAGGGEEGHVWDTALDYNKGKLNLNALVASEVNVLKRITKQSLEERESFIKEQQRLQEEGGENDEERDSTSGTTPPLHRRPRAEITSSSTGTGTWAEQSRPHTLKLSEVKKRMIKQPPSASGM